MSDTPSTFAIPYTVAAALRERITLDYRRDEATMVLALAGEASLSSNELAVTQRLATTLAEGVRTRKPVFWVIDPGDAA